MQPKIPAWQRREDLFLVPAGGWLLTGVALLSVFLAGGRPLWAQGFLALGIGLLWLIWTPRKLPAKPVVFMLALLALAPLAAYLPAGWLAMPEWRKGLVQYPALLASGFVTPQPWLTFHVWLLWLCGVALAAWCSCQDWDHYHRAALARMYAGGLFAITLFAIFGYATSYQPSWWQSTDGFGPFLNRNQWGAAMGFGGVVSIALIHQGVRQQNKSGAVFWMIALAVFTGAVICNGSRGGLVVLTAGGFAYWSFYAVIRKQYHYAAIGASFLLLAFALFAMGGGVLLERFVSLGNLMEGGASEDMRVQFYRMTMAMVAGSPFAGFGLGNFEYVFPFYLDFEPIFDRRPAHPESSWLWLASEGGWLILVVMTLAIVLLLAQGYAARRLRAATIRAAGLSCALVLAFNAFFEVSGHRIGTLFPVLVLASLALPLPQGGDFSPAVTRAARTLGAVLALTGLIWLLGGAGVPFLPAVQGVSALQSRAYKASEAGRAEDSIADLRRGASLRPIDWNIHWTLSGWLLRDRQIDAAWQEFRAANALLPYMYWTIEKEAEKWMSIAPGRAAMALLDAMARAPQARRPQMYANLLAKSGSNPVLHSTLLKLFAEEPEFEFVRIQQSSPESAAKRLTRFIRNTDNLSLVPDHVVPAVMRFMLDRNQTEALDRVVTENTRLKRLGWEVLVDRAIREQRVKDALDIYFEYGPHPSLPAALSRSDLRSVERAAALAPMDISTGIAYYQGLAAARRDDDAFWQLRRIMESPLAPPYIWFLAAQAAHRRGEDADAWGYLRTFQEKTKK